MWATSCGSGPSGSAEYDPVAFRAEGHPGYDVLVAYAFFKGRLYSSPVTWSCRARQGPRVSGGGALPVSGDFVLQERRKEHEEYSD